MQIMTYYARAGQVTRCYYIVIHGQKQSDTHSIEQ